MTAEAARRLLAEVAERYRETLGENLIGLYEHGSLAFGCFEWSVSDIDFLVVVKREPTLPEKKRLIGILLERLNDAPQKGFEMSVVLGKHLRPFVYPTPFELHYSNAHLPACRKDAEAYCMGMNGTDRDLAAHCTVIRAVGRRVTGEAVGKVFGEVPREDYLDSICFDVEGAKEDILENPVYVTLNLCRVLAAVRENRVLSKKEGGEWACRALDKRWEKLIRQALAAYAGGREPDKEEALFFAEHMLPQINNEIKTSVTWRKRT